MFPKKQSPTLSRVVSHLNILCGRSALGGGTPSIQSSFFFSGGVKVVHKKLVGWDHRPRFF